VIEVGAPLAGWVWPLSMTPDPAFADGVLGPGAAIDPVVGEVVSPFDGVVVSLHAARHAVVVRHALGPQMLVHVGIDTVALAGRGFEALASPGQAVRRGQPLIRFDLDAVARAAPSLVSPVVLIEAGGFMLEPLAVETEVVAGAPLFQLRVVEQVSAMVATPSAEGVERSVVVALAHGLHARPAAALARLARARGVEGALILQGGRSADLRSPVALMALAVRRGDQVLLRLSGPGGEATASALADLMEGGFEEVADAPVPRVSSPGPSNELLPGPGDIVGLCGAPGLAIGPTHRWTPTPAAADRVAGPPADEPARLEAALAQVASDLAAEAAWSGAAPGRAGILEAHPGRVGDHERRRGAQARIAEGTPAGAAWREATEGFAALLEGSGDPRLAGRAADLRDVQSRVLRALAGNVADGDPEVAVPAGAILLARDLPPSALARLATAGVSGFCLADSGPTAHVALIAASMGLPMLVAVGPALMALPDGVTMTLDADGGRLSPTPPGATFPPARPTAKRPDPDPAAPAFTLDGVRVTVMANLGSVAEVAAAVARGAEGCGLLRTEFLFMDNAGPPSEALQHASYRQVLEALSGRPLVIRTLDIGADKPAPWLPFPKEPNPALGRRGIRVSLARPDLLAVQLRAIASLPPEAPVSVMVPMVTRLAELRAVRAALDAARRTVDRSLPLPLGVMVETPAAVLVADQLAAEADFLSIGSNDLAQYVLAADRAGGDGSADAFDPAVLRAIALTIEEAARAATPVSVCGGLASDSLGAILLIGLGTRRLSCAPTAIPRVKALIRTVGATACEALARRALDAGSAAEVRALAREATRDAGGRN